ncbi:Inner membrane protein yabI [Pluralibacter gergoviae]|nr:Inner membrane protein yabI [Pluralibacter gergoviae]
MEAFLQHFITQSAAYALFAVALVAFLESLALVGLILPGAVLMTGPGGAYRQRRGQLLAGVAGGDYRLPAGRLDLLLARLAL